MDPTQTPNPLPQSPSNKISTKTVVVIFLTILAVVIGTTVVFYYTQKSTPSTQNPQNTIPEASPTAITFNKDTIAGTIVSATSSTITVSSSNKNYDFKLTPDFTIQKISTISGQAQIIPSISDKSAYLKIGQQITVVTNTANEVSSILIQ